MRGAKTIHNLEMCFREISRNDCIPAIFNRWTATKTFLIRGQAGKCLHIKSRAVLEISRSRIPVSGGGGGYQMNTYMHPVVCMIESSFLS